MRIRPIQTTGVDRHAATAAGEARPPVLIHRHNLQHAPVTRKCILEEPAGRVPSV